MAIHCINPNTIGQQAIDVFDLITGENQGGKGLLKAFENSISDLVAHWTGSDATETINNVIVVYEDLKTMLTNVQTYVVDVYNNQIRPLQMDIINAGGTCSLQNELFIQTIAAKEGVPHPVETEEARTDNAMIVDSQNFETIPTKFKVFMDSFNDLEKKLFDNWLEGAGRETAKESFNTITEDERITYLGYLQKTKERLMEIAEGKKPLI